MVHIFLMTSCLMQVPMEGTTRSIKGRRRKQGHIYVASDKYFLFVYVGVTGFSNKYKLEANPMRCCGNCGLVDCVER
jgi:hypothetical protein